MKTLALAGAALGLAITAAPALAAPSSGASINIDVTGLDLGTAQGQEALERQIHEAAKSVCGVDGVRTGTRIKSASSRECYKNARASVEKQVAAMIREQQRGG